MIRPNALANRILLLTLVFALAAACGSGRPPPVAPASKAPVVDVSQLDPGNYPTRPRAITSLKPDISVGDLVQESIRMADHLPLMFEIDDRLVIGEGGYAVTADYPPVDIKDLDDLAPGLIAGWSSGGRHRTSRLGLDLDLTVLRFTTPEQAAVAAQVIAADQDPGLPDKGPLTVPGYPSAISALTYLEAVKTTYAQDDYVYWIWAGDDLTVPEGPGSLLAATKKVLDRTLESMKSFQPTPIDRLAGLAGDPEDLLGRTLPLNQGPDAIEGVFSPHAALTGDDRPVASKRAYDDAGVDLVARSLSNIYRTRDAAGAQRFVGEFVDELTDRYRPIDPPPGLATARCLQQKDENGGGAKFMCYLPFERYVAEVYADQSQDLRQRLSAQYELLAFGHI